MDEPRLKLVTADDVNKISLVQRVKVKDTTTAGNIDARFSFDYMGSSEFEFGALFQALRTMRATTLCPEPQRIKVGEHVCWYVGPDIEFAAAAKLFEDQLKPREDRKGHTKERSNIRENYVVEPEPLTVASMLKAKKQAAKVNYDLMDGWWAIEATFVLFKQKAHAMIWLDALAYKSKS